jgi:hypothetical protein
MQEEMEIAGIKVPKADWDVTPASIKAVVVVLSERLSAMEEQLKQNSENSSRPPSSDGLNKPKAAKSQKAGAQKGKSARTESSPRKKRPKLYPIERCQVVHRHVPQICQRCGAVLTGRDEAPKRHQIMEIPVIEHQLHQLECDCCGIKLGHCDPQRFLQQGMVTDWLRSSGGHRAVEWGASP